MKKNFNFNNSIQTGNTLKKEMNKQPTFNEKIEDTYKTNIDLPDRTALLLRNSNKLTVFDDNIEAFQIEQEKLRAQQVKDIILKQTYDIHQGMQQLINRQPMRTQIFSMADDDTNEAIDTLGEDLEAAKERKKRAKLEAVKKEVRNSLVTNVHNIRNILVDMRRNERAKKELERVQAAIAAEEEVIQKDIKDYDNDDLISTVAPSALSAIPESSMYSGPVSEQEAYDRKKNIRSFNPNDYILKEFTFSTPTQSSQISQQSAIQSLLRNYDNLTQQEQWVLFNFMTKKYKPGQQQYKPGKSAESLQTSKEAMNLVNIAVFNNRYKNFYNSLSDQEKKANPKAGPKAGPKGPK